MSNLVNAARKQCHKQPGCTTDSLGEEGYTILRGFLDTFARFFLDQSPPMLLLRVRNDVREQLAAAGGNIRISDDMLWEPEGWQWADVGLDESIPAETLMSLIDDSYQLAYDGLQEFSKQQLALLARNLPPLDMLDELIKAQGLSRWREEIKKLARPALLMKTSPVAEAELALGQTKIGGCPDLPADVAWPTFHHGKPLAFLAQINFDKIKLAGAPKPCVVCLFSVFGWQVEGEYDPQLPRGDYAANWTQALCFDAQAVLERRPTPPEVNAFQAAQVEFVPIVSLPTDGREPEIARLGWSEIVCEKYESMVASFNAVCGHRLGDPPRHLLMGHADYEQMFVKEVARKELRLLLQLACDQNTEMCWGDGGYLYFWIPPQDLARREFRRIFTDYQCG